MIFKCDISTDYSKKDVYHFECFMYSEVMHEIELYLQFKKSKFPSYLLVEWITS